MKLGRGQSSLDSQREKNWRESGDERAGGRRLHGRSLGRILFCVSHRIRQSVHRRAADSTRMGLCRKSGAFRFLGWAAWRARRAFRAPPITSRLSDQVAVVLSVELCSLTLAARRISRGQPDFFRTLRRRCGRVLVAGADCGLSGPKILATRSVFYPDTEEMMAGMCRKRAFGLCSRVKFRIWFGKNLAHDLDDFLAERGLTRADIGSWVLHTGGPKFSRRPLRHSA